MNELFKLFKGFYDKKSQLVMLSILLSIISSSIETIIVPKLIANIFNNIEDKSIFRSQIILLLSIWIIVKIVYSLSTLYKRQLEPEIISFITIELIEKIFNKYEHENILTNISSLINRMQSIKKSFQEISYLATTVFIPRCIVIFLSCLSIYTINKQLGVTLLFCLIFQILFSSFNLSDCVNKSFDENENKDSLYEYIEDLFYNIDTIELTPNGFQFELSRIIKLTEEAKIIEQKSLDCVTYKQYYSYIINYISTCIIFYSVYKKNIQKEIDSKQTTTIILLIVGMFDNVSEISYYIPETTAKIGTLMMNEKFLQELNYEERDVDIDKKMLLTNGNIELQNVSFMYENHKILDNFCMIIPEKSFLCLYGPSGSGKSTFIKLIYGIEKPSSGSVMFGGNDISLFHVRESRKYISYLNQNTTNLFNTSVYFNIIYGYDDTPQLKEQVKNVFLKFNFYEIFKNLDKNKEMWSFLDEEVGKLGENLSGGQKQIIHLLRLDLNQVSTTVILDEPSAALDDKTRESASRYIKYLNSKGKTIILITHDDFYKEICDKMLMFSNSENPIVV